MFIELLKCDLINSLHSGIDDVELDERVVKKVLNMLLMTDGSLDDVVPLFIVREDVDSFVDFSFMNEE